MQGLTLREIRMRRGLTQSEAAVLIGVSVDTISNWERGKSYPDVPMIRNIEEVYRVRYSDIIFLPLNYD